MEKRAKKKIGRQLISEADVIQNQNGNQLAASVLRTSAALINVADMEQLDESDEDGVEKVFAEYYSLVSKLIKIIGDMTNTLNREKLDEMSSSLERLMDEFSKIDKERVELNEKLIELRIQRNEQDKEILNIKEEEREENTKLETAKRKVNDINSKIMDLRIEQGKLQKEYDNYEIERKKVEEQLNLIKEQCAELKAAHPEFEFIKKGIIDEGYIDVEDFLKKTDEMNKNAEKLITDYDSLLAKTIKDEDEINNNIENKQHK